MSHDPAATQIAAASERLRAGGVVAFPTETVYGLGADAFNEEAVRRVFRLKGRPSTNPLIVHVTGQGMAAQVVANWTDEADKLARAFWPGPLSIILPRAERIPYLVTAGGGSVAVRSPDHPVALALLFEFGSPLVGPSANLSGRVSPTRPEHVRRSFNEDDVMVLEGGPCSTGIESTVLLLHSDGTGWPRVLRRGVIGADAIAGVLGRAVADTPARATTSDKSPQLSPGLAGQHYAPSTPAVLFGASDWPLVTEPPKDRIAVISHVNREVHSPHALIRLPANAASYAAALYDALRRADDMALDLIAIERPPLPSPDSSPGGPTADDAIWSAIADRLERAVQR